MSVQFELEMLAAAQMHVFQNVKNTKEKKGQKSERNHLEDRFLAFSSVARHLSSLCSVFGDKWFKVVW